MNIFRVGEKFVASSRYHEKDILKQAGFRWDNQLKYWWTDSLDAVSKVHQYLNKDIAEKVKSEIAQRDVTVAESRATDSDINIPAPEGKDYLPFQKAGIEFISNRANSLLSDEMGLGKSVQTIGLINLDPTIQTVLIVCPASLKINWKKELESWLVRPMSIGIAKTQKIVKEEKIKLPLPSTNIVIINYDILEKFQAEIRRQTWDLLVCDEAHFLRGRTTRRAKQVIGKRVKHSRVTSNKWEVTPIPAHRKLFLTGTPIVNRPVELWPIISTLDPTKWSDYDSFQKRYCNARKGRWGWEAKGSTNLEELQLKLRTTLMIRRLKADVLKDLPPKIRQIVPLSQNGARKVIEAEMLALRQHQAALHELRFIAEVGKASENKAEYAEAVDRLRTAVNLTFGELATTRKNTAIAKVPYVLEVLDGVSEKTVIFAHHREVIRLLKEALGDEAVVLAGGTSTTARNKAVEAFQNDPKIKYFIGSIQAAGVGLTLTASSCVIFAELDWTPASMCQAEDRCVLGGQLVMTIRGLKPIEDIKVGEKVLTHLGNWKEVIATHNRLHKKYLTKISYQRYGEPLVVTNDHRVLLHKGGYSQYVEAQDVKPGDMLVLKSNEISPMEDVKIESKWRVGEDFIGPGGLQANGRYKPLSDPFPWSSELAYLMGYYLANGFSSTSSNKGRFVSFSGHIKKLPILLRIKTFLTSHGISVSEPRPGSENGLEMRAYSGDLANWFMAWFGHGAANKRLPNRLMCLPIEDTESLLMGYVDGDGYRRKNQTEWVSVSLSLASQMAVLAKRCGYSPTLRMVKNDENYGQWIGCFTNDSERVDVSLQKVLSVETFHAKKAQGKYPRVHDLTVEDDHSFVVGLAAVHNCHRIGAKNSVLIQHLVFDESVDANIAKTIISKQAVIDRALDSLDEDDMPVTPLPDDEDSATAKSSFKDIEEEAKDIVPETILAIHSALRYMANLCDGSKTKDGIGFNSFDAEIGHHLARQERLTQKQAALGRKILRKYAKQLGPEMTAFVSD